MTTPERKPISDAQRELLSAYLDNQLGGVERAALERSLASDAALRAELEELRAVRQLLRALPALALPRSFTISPQQARRRALPLFGWLRASSALAAVLLMLTFLPGLLGAFDVGSPAPSAGVASAPTTLEPPLSQAREAVTAAAAPASEPAFKATAGPPAAESAPMSAPAIGPAETPTPAAAAAGEAPNVASNSSTAASYAPTPAQAGALVESTRTAMDAGDAAVSDPQSSSSVTGELPPQQAVPGRPLSPLRWAQLALAALAVALGVGALLARSVGR